MQGAGKAARHCLHLLLGALGQLQDALRALVQQFAGLGQLHSARPALQKLQVQLILLKLQLVAQWGLGKVQLFGGRRDAALLGNGGEIEKLAYVQNKGTSLYIIYKKAMAVIERKYIL